MLGCSPLSSRGYWRGGGCGPSPGRGRRCSAVSVACSKVVLRLESWGSPPINRDQRGHFYTRFLVKRKTDSVYGILLLSSMPRATPAPLHRPLYRQILRDALALAWKEKRFWPLALLTVFLQTGGIYDVFLLSLRSALNSPLTRDDRWHEYFLQVQRLDWVNRFALTQSILLSLALIFLILFFSVIAQGTLIGCLDRGQTTMNKGFRQILQAAAKRVVPLGVLNILMLGVAGLGSLALRVFTTAIEGRSGDVIWFSIASLVYLMVLFVATSLHMFALNGVMADGMTLHEALVHAWELLRKAWLTIVETAFLMMIIGALIFSASLLIALFAGLPAVGFLVASVYLGFPKIFVFVNIAIAAIVLLAAIIGGLFAVNFQYSTWNRLYRRAIEGTAHSKLVRVFHSLTSRRSARATAK